MLDFSVQDSSSFDLCLGTRTLLSLIGACLVVLWMVGEASELFYACWLVVIIKLHTVRHAFAYMNMCTNKYRVWNQNYATVCLLIGCRQGQKTEPALLFGCLAFVDQVRYQHCTTLWLLCCCECCC